jgi:ABC-type amino acid transport substrate-binding protein
MKGVGYDLGKELARRMGISFEPVVYPSIGAVVDSAKSDQWDVAFITVVPGRAKDMDLTAPYVEIERGYLVPTGSHISTVADVDRPGIRVAVPADGGSDIFLSRVLKKRRSGPRQRRRNRDAQVWQGRRICFQQGNPVRIVESVARLPSSGRSFCHRPSGYGHSKRT